MRKVNRFLEGQTGCAFECYCCLSLMHVSGLRLRFLLMLAALALLHLDLDEVYLWLTSIDGAKIRLKNAEVVCENLAVILFPFDCF